MLGGVIVILLAAGSWVALTHASAKSTSPTASASSGHVKAKAAKAAVLTVASSSPAQHQQNVSGTDPIQLRFSAPLADGTPMPTITPSVPGTWHRTAKGSTIVFDPTQGFPGDTFVQVHIQGGPSGVRAKGGAQLAASTIMYFHTASYSTARLPELLAQLGYLPLSWAPAAGQTSPALGDAAGQLAAAYNAPAGTFTWKPGYPPGLTAFWDNGSPDGLIVHGAVMAFESNNGLTMDGIAGPEVWKALLAAADTGKMNPNGYSYAVASQVQPETLTVWHNGKVILHALANTGIPAAPTTVGTDPVYERLQAQVMRGLNPNGTPYADQVYWVSYFRAGEAVHYFPRASYGFQQSLGCVELPYNTAKFIWPYLTYGTLVTVTAA